MAKLTKAQKAYNAHRELQNAAEVFALGPFNMTNRSMLRRAALAYARAKGYRKEKG